VARKLSFSKSINADSKQVFSQIARFENYSEFIPRCSKAKLLEKNDDFEIGELTFNFFLKTYLLRSKNILTDNTINIEQIKGPFDFFTGQWSVRGNEFSSTDVSFDAEFKLPFILENIITDQVINDFCENALEAFIDKLQIKN
jgi:ribosome-associated toxin RatA of RatAB toxin-antitoxin module